MATPADDHSEIMFTWPEYTNQWSPLNSGSAMFFFENSPWYKIEPPSNNQILRMQNTGMDASTINEAEQLRSLVGVEFVMTTDNAPSFFVIQKRRRLSPDEVYPMESYYITNDRILQAPNLYTLLSSRLNTSVHHLMTAMSLVSRERPPYSQTRGYHWPVDFDPTSAFTKKDSGSSRRTAAGSVDGSVMDVDMRGGSQSREGSVRPSGTGGSDPSQVNITMPLLNAIRTTANHLHHKSILAASRGVGPLLPTSAPAKRVVRNAMALATLPNPATATTHATPGDLTKLSIPTGSFTAAMNSPAADVGSPVVMTGPGAGNKISSTPAPVPGTRPGTPSSAIDAATPIGTSAPVKKKKKKAGVSTPVTAQSPHLPGV